MMIMSYGGRMNGAFVVLLCMVSCIIHVAESSHCTASGPLPDGFVYDATLNSCYYFMYISTGTWLEADGACNRMHSKLVAIESAAEQTYIWNKITADGQNSKTFWTGGNNFGPQWRLNRPGATSLNIVTYSNWNAGEPNNPLLEHCLELSTGGGWNDVPCESRRFYICELN
ncbi:unnamed protein product [Owenia fusiformis]|uniref:Uncharacterized protein n=1 Tax=Owenia fusiformis TaxID=6347 RepID=A0A8J1U625_OWEFU|nr:unnamed protein product [Owenia fusiformis]